MILFYKGEVYEWINEHWARSKKITEQTIKILNGNFPLDSRDFLGKEDVNVNMELVQTVQFLDWHLCPIPY